MHVGVKGAGLIAAVACRGQLPWVRASTSSWQARLFLQHVTLLLQLEPAVASISNHISSNLTRPHPLSRLYLCCRKRLICLCGLKINHMTDAQNCVFILGLLVPMRTMTVIQHMAGGFIYILLSLTCPCWSLYSHIVPLLQYGFFHLLYERKNLFPGIFDFTYICPIHVFVSFKYIPNWPPIVNI